jgi:hypothetical protein
VMPSHTRESPDVLLQNGSIAICSHFAAGTHALTAAGSSTVASTSTIIGQPSVFVL